MKTVATINVLCIGREVPLADLRLTIVSRAPMHAVTVPWDEALATLGASSFDAVVMDHWDLAFDEERQQILASAPTKTAVLIFPRLKNSPGARQGTRRPSQLANRLAKDAQAAAPVDPVLTDGSGACDPAYGQRKKSSSTTEICKAQLKSKDKWQTWVARETGYEPRFLTRAAKELGMVKRRELRASKQDQSTAELQLLHSASRQDEQSLTTHLSEGE